MKGDGNVANHLEKGSSTTQMEIKSIRDYVKVVYHRVKEFHIF